jgi:hypothetical protein
VHVQGKAATILALLPGSRFSGSALVSEHALANCGPSDVSCYSFFHTLLFVCFVLLLFWVQVYKITPLLRVLVVSVTTTKFQFLV